MKIKINKSNPAFHFLFQELIALIYWRIKYLKLRYGLSLLKIHEKYKKYIFCIIFYASPIKNDKKTKKGKESNIFKSLARSNVFSTKSDEQEINLVWPNLRIFWLLFICLYRLWSWSLPNFVWMNISGYQNYRSSLLMGSELNKNHIFRFCAFWGSLSKEIFFL
jgi:hypothetical protein